MSKHIDKSIILYVYIIILFSTKNSQKFMVCE